MKKISNHLISKFFAGLIVIIPIFGIIQFGSFIKGLLDFSKINGEGISGVFLGVAFVLFIGHVITNVWGKSILSFIKKILCSAPLAGPVLETILSVVAIDDEGGVFKKVVLISDGSDSYEIGFLTSDKQVVNNKNKLSVFIPSVPIPANGKLIFIDSNKVIETDIKPHEAFRTIFTLGNQELNNSYESFKSSHNKNNT